MEHSLEQENILHKGSQLSQQVYLLVSLLEKQVVNTGLPESLYQKMMSNTVQLNAVLNDLQKHLKELSSLPHSPMLQPSTEVVLADPLQLEFNHYRIRCGTQLVRLTKLECKLHQLLAHKPEYVYTRSALIDALYSEAEINERTIDCNIRKLRIKHQRLYPNHRFIQSMYGVGYYYRLPLK